MSVISIQNGEAGLSGIVPSFLYIDTDSTVAEVTTAGFLDFSKSQGYSYNNKQMALVSTQIAGVATTDLYTVSVNPTTKSVTLTAI
jgi:hypothetical protein